MTPNDYLAQSERTERKFPDGAHINTEVATALVETLLSANYHLRVLDLFKKNIIYGAPLTQQDLVDIATTIAAQVSELPDPEPLTLTPEQIELLHAALGLLTEAGEFAEQLIAHIFMGDPLDRVNLAEELGDGLWYVALALRRLDTTFMNVMQTNIEKLQARFPDKFTEHHALNRDLDTERSILEQGARPCPS